MILENVTIKLYPFEYIRLYHHLEKINSNVESLGFNSSVGHMVLAQFFERKNQLIKKNALNKSGKMQSLTLKPVEGVALYFELMPYSYSCDTLCQIFGHLNRSLTNLGFVTI